MSDDRTLTYIWKIWEIGRILNQPTSIDSDNIIIGNFKYCHNFTRLDEALLNAIQYASAHFKDQLFPHMHKYGVKE